MVKLACLLLVALCAAATLAMPFEEYVRVFNKPYAVGTKEYNRRKVQYVANLVEIQQHNGRADKEYEKGVNMFTDMSVQERRAFLGYNKQARKALSAQHQQPAPVFHKRVEDLPSSVDWRTKGIITPVKNQGGCGSCWAFASTETIEAYAALSVNPPRQVILAPQQLVSCAPNPQACGGTGGCEGSIAELAFDYIAGVGGMTTEKSYPYTARDSKCIYNASTTPPAVSLTGHVKLPENNYTALMNAVATIGPMAVNVEADTWFSYSRGIFPSSGCSASNTVIDHVVQLVGYGTEGGKDYWIVRNSWGPTWGENGFIRMERRADGTPCSPDKSPDQGTACKPYPASVNVCGACGILYDSSYPTGVKLL